MTDIKCPLCKSEKIRCTDLTSKELKITKEKSSYARFYCQDCKKAMTITGILVSTINEVVG